MHLGAWRKLAVRLLMDRYQGYPYRLNSPQQSVYTNATRDERPAFINVGCRIIWPSVARGEVDMHRADMAVFRRAPVQRGREAVHGWECSGEYAGIADRIDQAQFVDGGQVPI